MAGKSAARLTGWQVGRLEAAILRLTGHGSVASFGRVPTDAKPLATAQSNERTSGETENHRAAGTEHRTEARRPRGVPPPRRRRSRKVLDRRGHGPRAPAGGPRAPTTRRPTDATCCTDSGAHLCVCGDVRGRDVPGPRDRSRAADAWRATQRVPFRALRMPAGRGSPCWLNEPCRGGKTTGGCRMARSCPTSRRRAPMCFWGSREPGNPPRLRRRREMTGTRWRSWLAASSAVASKLIRNGRTQPSSLTDSMRSVPEGPT